MSAFNPHDPMFGLLAMAALLIGLVLWLVGSGMLIVQSFKTSFWWGIGVVVLTLPVLYIFIGMYWKRARMGFVLHLVGLGLMIAGGYMAWLMGVDFTPLERYTI